MIVKLCLFLVFSASVSAQLACEKAVMHGDYVKAITICEDELISSADKEVEIWLHLVAIYHAIGDEEQESYYLAKIKNHPQYLEHIEYQYQWNRKVGQKYYFLSEYQQAHKYLLNGLVIAEKENQPLWLSKSLNDVGLTSFKLREYAKSLTYFQQSLTHKLNHGTAYQVGNTFNNIALVHMELEEFELAIDYYEQALNQYVLYTHQADIDERVYEQISHLYEDLSKAYTVNGDVLKAQKYADKIVETFKAKMSPRSQARALINIGKHNLSLDAYQKAQFFYDEAKKIHQTHGYEFNAEFYLDAANVYFHNKKNVSALEAIDIGMELAVSANDNNTVSQFHQLLSEYFIEIDANKAYEHLKMFQTQREQFLQEKYDADINNIKHQIEKQKIQHELVNEQLVSAKKSVELQRLTNTVLIVVIALLLMITLFIYHFINKKKERTELIQSIKHHKQQLFMMQNQQFTIVKNNEPLSNDELKNEFKVKLVSTLIDALSLWEKTTGSDRIELAEQSKAWTVSIDNGTLRTRSLDKYLDLEKIPANPRWRNVVKTCHFILARDDIGPNDRRTMENKLAVLLDLIKQLSLLAN